MTDCYGQALRESVEVAWVCVGGGSQRLWCMQVQIAVRSGLWVWGQYNIIVLYHLTGADKYSKELNRSHQGDFAAR